MLVFKSDDVKYIRFNDERNEFLVKTRVRGTTSLTAVNQFNLVTNDNGVYRFCVRQTQDGDRVAVCSPLYSTTRVFDDDTVKHVMKEIISPICKKRTEYSSDIFFGIWKKYTFPFKGMSLQRIPEIAVGYYQS